MPKLVPNSAKKKGLPPGTLIHVGKRADHDVKTTIIEYDANSAQQREAAAIEDCWPIPDALTVTWINVDGLHQIDIIEKVGKQFQIHPLVLEDIVHAGQRPKAESFDNYIYVVLRMLNYDQASGRVRSEQVSFLLGDSFVISFQEKIGDVFDPVRERIRSGKGRIRRAGADYLLYALLDAVVDNYFGVLEKIAEKIEMLQERVAVEPSQDMLKRIHSVKREMVSLRKNVWPVRELVNVLQRG